MEQNAKKPNTTDEPIGYRARRDMLLRLLPLHSFKIAPAAREAGYSPNYARHKLPGILKKDDYFCCQVERLKAVNLASNADKVRALDTRLDNILDSCELQDGQRVPPSVYYRFMELRYKRLGALSADACRPPEPERPRLTPEQIESARKQAMKLLLTPSKD